MFSVLIRRTLDRSMCVCRHAVPSLDQSSCKDSPEVRRTGRAVAAAAARSLRSLGGRATGVMLQLGRCRSSCCWWRCSYWHRHRGWSDQDVCSRDRMPGASLPAVCGGGGQEVVAAEDASSLLQVVVRCQGAVGCQVMVGQPCDGVAVPAPQHRSRAQG